jgi:hypothetical protein
MPITRRYWICVWVVRCHGSGIVRIRNLLEARASGRGGSRVAALPDPGEAYRFHWHSDCFIDVALEKLFDRVNHDALGFPRLA